MKFKDVEHLYLGCKLLYPDGEIQRLVGVSIDGYEFDKTSFPNARVTDDSKPILRRLEDLTEEHKQELGSTSGLSPYRSAGCPSRWLKLLSWGYDLFGLIDSGEAIDAKTMEV